MANKEFELNSPDLYEKLEGALKEAEERSVEIGLLQNVIFETRQTFKKLDCPDFCKINRNTVKDKEDVIIRFCDTLVAKHLDNEETITITAFKAKIDALIAGIAERMEPNDKEVQRYLYHLAINYFLKKYLPNIDFTNGNRVDCGYDLAAALIAYDNLLMAYADFKETAGANVYPLFQKRVRSILEGENKGKLTRREKDSK